MYFYDYVHVVSVFLLVFVPGNVLIQIRFFQISLFLAGRRRNFWIISVSKQKITMMFTSPCSIRIPKISGFIRKNSSTRQRKTLAVSHLCDFAFQKSYFDFYPKIFEVSYEIHQVGT